jgi:exosortase
MSVSRLVDVGTAPWSAGAHDVAHPGSSGTQNRRTRAHLLVAAFAGAVALCYLPLLIWFAYDLWWLHPQYRFAAILWGAALWIGYDRARDITLLAPRQLIAPALGAGLLWAASLLSLLLATAIWWPRLGAISFLLALAAMTLTFGGPRLARALIPSGILLLVSIPPPMGLDSELARILQGWAVRGSGLLLDLLNVVHAISANVIQVPGRRLLVEEACSGINSLIAIVCFTLLFGFWERRGPVRILILIAFAVAFVLAANLLRITAGAFLLVKMKIDIFPESIHEITGIALFVITLGLVISADQLLHFFSGDRIVLGPLADPAHEEAAKLARSGVGRQRRVARSCFVLSAVYVLLLFGQLTGLWVRGAKFPGFFDHSHLRENASFSLPDSVAGWERSAINHDFGLTPEVVGRESKSWVFRRGPLRAIVALDGPFSGFHDVTVCYKSAGWEVSKDNKRSLQSDQVGMAHADLKNLNIYGDLLFSLANEEGKWLEPEHAIDYSATGRLGRWTANDNPDPVATHQIQVLTCSYEPLTDAQRESVTGLFLASRAELARQLLEQVERRQ